MLTPSFARSDFTLTRNDAMPKPATPNEPWGVMMEIGYPKMVMTTVAFSDGTASVMRSSGGGFFGGGAIGAVKTAAEDFWGKPESRTLK